MTGFVIIWIGELISTVGSGLTAWGLGVWVYEETNSQILFGISLFCAVLPTVLIAPVAGWIVDRYSRRLVLIVADSGAALSTLAIAVLLQLEMLEVWHIYAAITVNAVCTTFQWPAYGAAVTMLVPREHLGRSSGMVQFAEGLSQWITPGLAGLLFVTVGLQGIIVVDFVTFLAAISALLIVFIPNPPKPTEAHVHGEPFLSQISYGWRYIKERPGLLGILSYFAVANFAGSISIPLLTVLMLTITTPDQVGLAGSVAGFGMLLGTLVMSAWGGPKRRVFGIIGGDIIGAIFIIVTGLAPSIPVITLGMFGLLFTLPISNGSSQAMWQSKTDPAVQGRVFSVRRMIAHSITPIGYFLSGFVSQNVFEPLMAVNGPLAHSVGRVIGAGHGRGIGLLLIVSGAVYLAAALTALAYPRSRRVDIELPDVRVEPDAAPAAS
jgi:MFS family permease